MLAGSCQVCGEKLKRVLHYEERNSYTYGYCKKCNYQSEPKKIMYFPNDEKELKN